MNVASDSLTFCCIHGDDCIRRLRHHDWLACLREIRRRAVRDWGWTLPSSFNLDLDCGRDGLVNIVHGTLTDSGILIV